MLVVVIVAVSGGDDSGPTVSGDAADSNGSAADAPAADGPTFQGQQEDDTVAEAGQSITVDDVVTTTTPLVEGEDALGSNPTLCTTVTIVNNSDEAASFNGAFDWNLQDPAGASRGSTFLGSDNLLNSGELAPGGTVTGDVCFDNPTGATGQYAVIYEPGFSFSDDRAVWVNNR